MEKYGVKLSKWASLKVNYGIKTGLNEAFVIDEVTRNLILENCKDTEERKRTDAIIRPILRGRDIKNGKITNCSQYLICTHNGFNDRFENKVNKINVCEYPAIKSHLDKFYEKLKKRDDQGDTPYNLRSCAYMDDFYKRKIVFPAIMTGGAFFAIDENKTIVLAPGNYLIVNNLDAVLQYLIDIGYFALRTFYMGGGIEGELKVNRLLLLPVPTANENNLISKLHLSDEELQYITKFNSTLLN